MLSKLPPLNLDLISSLQCRLINSSCKVVSSFTYDASKGLANVLNNALP
jgi:hypothetical protein